MEKAKGERAYFGSLIRLAVSLFLAAVVIVTVLMARADSRWVGDWYLSFSQAVLKGLAVLTGSAPFSVAEVLTVGLLLWALVFLAVTVYKIIRRGQPLLRAVRYLSHVLLAAMSLAALFMFSWGFSYYAPNLSDRLGYDVPDTAPENLYEVCYYLREELNLRSKMVPRDENGVSMLGSFQELAERTAQAAETFFDASEEFSGSTVPVKPLFFSELFSRRGITGIFICITGESNVNGDAPDSLLPFTMAHEMAHRAAVAPEQEANFVAFLITTGAEDPLVSYSGFYGTFIYCSNALGEVAPELRWSLYEGLDEGVLRDFLHHNEWADRYEGEELEQARQMNDTYLKTMNQSHGVASYGEVVDLVLSWYQAEEE